MQRGIQTHGSDVKHTGEKRQAVSRIAESFLTMLVVPLLGETFF